MPDSKFPNTSWTLIVRAGDPRLPEGREALASLCESYRSPVHAFICRRCGSADEAEDLTQGFFASLLASDDLATVDRTRGSKFRSWLLACVRNYLKNQRKREAARKRPPPGNGVSIEEDEAEGHCRAELSHHLTPERLYERKFALVVLARALDALRARYDAAGKLQRFEALKGRLTGDAEQRPYEEVATALGIEVGAVKKAAFDLRERYREQLVAEVTSLLVDPDLEQVDEELRQLLAALED